MESFGDLLRFGTFAVVKGDSGKDSEREVSAVAIRGAFEDRLLIGTSLVPYFPVRADSSVLQGYQSEQAEDQAHDEQRQAGLRYQEASSPVEGSNLHGKCHRHRVSSEAW